MRITCIFLFLFLFLHTANAQDIHWSQFSANPVFQNPGNAGNFQGDMRFVGNFRDQWRSVSVPFQTLSLSVDGKPYTKRNIGLGGLFFHDISGDGTFRTIEMQINANYQILFGRDSTHTVRPGINFGMNHRQVNWDAFKYGNQYNGQQYDPTIASNETYTTDRKTNFSFGVGAVYNWSIAKRKKLDVGFGAFNLNRPNQGFFSNNVPRDIRITAFSNFQYPLGFDLDLLPGIQFSRQGKYTELMFGSSVRYTLIDKLGEYRAIQAGLWMRGKDATFISVGMNYQSWFVGLSYDINFSSLVPASKARGGFEIAVQYILFRVKPKNIIHRICPDYI